MTIVENESRGTAPEVLAPTPDILGGVVAPSSPAGIYEDVDLAIVCEATYPYLRGGLSAVVHQLAVGSPHLRIGIIHLTWDSTFSDVDIYGMPSNVAWVMPVYQSMAEHKQEFQALKVADMKMSRRQQRKLLDRFFAAVEAHLAGDDEPLWQLYDDGINPRTRKFNIWPMLSTKAFTQRAVEEFGPTDAPLASSFWWLRDFVSLAYAATAPNFPRASVYHAHTTGAAGLIAAAAARQHATSFLLTEHCLYARDAINHLLERSMDTVVSIDDWRELTTFTTRLGEEREVSTQNRFWMQWYTRLGVIAYRAADRITYLYPEAIEEAAGLGGDPAKSVVVPNGIDDSPFAAARARFEERAEERRQPDHLWRLAYVGRVVPMKGLTDLLVSLDDLRRRGLENFVVDVMGPDGEFPDYVELTHSRVAELGLTEHVRFRGSVDLKAELGEFDVLVMPSHNEGLPIAMLETMSVGLPVIATDVGGIREVVTGQATNADGTPLESCGIVIEAHDTLAMTDSLERLFTEPGLFDQYSRNALARIEGLFRIELTLAQYHSLFDELGIDASANVPVDAKAMAQPVPRVQRADADVEPHARLGSRR